MHIHFVCSGNSYRSRLAEAYCQSKLQHKNLSVSSSGIEADIHRFGNGPICWYAMRLMKKNNLIPHMSWRERQTTTALLNEVDYLICMNQMIADKCVNDFGYKDKTIEVWNIPDLNEMDGFIPSKTPGIQVDINNIKLTEQVYGLITQKVDDLLTRIKKNQGKIS